MRGRRSVLVLLVAGSVIAGLATSSPSYATGPTAGPPSPAATGSSHHGAAAKPPRDSTPPQPVTDLRMAGNTARSISLSWTNPTDPDFAGVLIRRAAGDTPPITASDGTLVATLSSRKTTFTDKHLTAAHDYSYAMFGRDKSRNVGIAATLTTATRSTSTATGLRGKLTDQQGRGISQAWVEVREPSTGGWMGYAVTATTGQFSVTGLAPGVYSVCFLPNDYTAGHSATGYLRGCYRQQPFGYGDTGTPVTVQAGKMTSGLVDYLPVAGAVAGRVTDSAGHGIAGVSVSAFQNPSEIDHGATTGADGSYTVTGLSAGSHQVCFYSQGASGASTTGYLDECYDDQPPYDMGTPVPVTLGHTSAGIDAVLATGGAIAGRVTDPSGAPVQGVLVSVFGAGYGNGTSDGSGAYAITGLPTGSYTLCFDGSYTSSDTAPYGYTNSCAGEHWRTVYVVAGQTATVNGVVEKAGAVGGVVTGEDGPVPGVWVDVYDSSGRQLNSTGTGDDGSYQVTGLAPGQVTVCFDPTFTAGGYQRTCYGAQADGSGSPITVTAGQLSTADVQLSHGASITGTITDASGAPISGVLVNAYGNTQFNGYYAQTDDAGSYTIGGVIADDYRICFDPSYAQSPAAAGYAAECYDNQPSVDAANLVTVGPAGSVTVDAVLSAGAAITGQVTGSDGAVLGGVYVYANNVEPGQQGFATYSDNQDGSYRLSGLTEGDYLVCFSASFVFQPSSTGYVDECYDNQGVSSPGTPVHVTAGGVTAGIDAELAVGAAATGQVTDSDGTGIPNIFVQISGVDGSYLNPVGTTDDVGRYQITGLPAGAVVVCFLPGDGGGANGTGYQSECYDNQPDASTANPVTTTAGQVSAGVDAELDLGAAITGRVTDSAGTGIRDVSAYTYGVDGSYLGRSGMTDDTGRYQVTGLPATAVVVCFETYPEGGANGTGYLSECYDNQPDASTANPVDTTAGEVRAGIDAELADAPAA
jgi:protocatechuate 3,4-dioxygenase beta subunit